MGANTSSFQDLQRNEHLNRLVSKEILTHSDPFWNSLLSYNFNSPQTKNEWRAFEASIEELLKRFLISNLKTGNFVSLLRVILLRHSELKTSVQTENNLFIWQTYNALFIIRTIVKFMSETVSESDLIGQFNIVLPHEEEESEAMFTQFLSTLVQLLIEIPLKENTYGLHLEGSRLMIAILSVAMHSPSKPANQLLTWREMMLGDVHYLATPLTCTLLLRYMDQQTAPASVLGQEGGSIVLGLASGVWNILTLGYSSVASSETEEVSSKPLADLSLTLLLLLVNHCTDTEDFLNPYRDALFNFSNSSDKTAESPQVSQVPSFQIEYPPLYNALADTLQSDESTLLLYLLLHRNPGFKNFVLAATDIDQLVVPILQTLYRAPESNNHHIYMSLIILLILSEDDLFNKTVHGCVLKSAQVSWYTERAITELSLGGLLILVVIRTIQYNMLKMRDKYLHTNCLAALANMSSQFRTLHPYVAQRIVSLFETLARKHSRLVDGLRGVDTDDIEDGFDEVSDAVQDAAVLEEVLRMVLEIINSCLVHQTQHNPNLIYTILYKREMFDTYARNPAFQDLMHNIMIVIVNMSSRLEQVSERKGCSLGVGEVQEVVRQGAIQFPKDKLRKLPDLKFKYVEEDQPEDFFIPYVWTLATQQMQWDPEQLSFNS